MDAYLLSCSCEVPSDCIGYVTGSRRAALGAMEEEWGTLMFFMSKGGDKAPLLICLPAPSATLLDSVSLNSGHAEEVVLRERAYFCLPSTF